MNIINKKTVTVSTDTELKEVLENNNGYEYIYLENDITLKSGIQVNSNKSKITINGTYQNTLHTLSGMNSIDTVDTIVITATTKQVLIKNIKIVYTNPNGIIYVPEDTSNEEIVIIYDNVIFNGTKLSFNPYGVIKINDSNITIENTNGIESKEICEASRVIIGGKTNILSSSPNQPLFTFMADDISPYIVFLCKSDVIISTDAREFMTGTNKLNFTILHDTKVHLTTGNGFSSMPNYGANNVLIEERASFIFIEKSHKGIPMWAIFGNFTMKEDSQVQIINSYSNTPSDNYNIHFKGSDCKMNLYNPKNITLYTKNSNVIYTDNPITFNINCTRINMWQNSTDISLAGDINNLPDYSWYKDSGLLKIEGTITSSLTSITRHNITASELSNMPDISNFIFQNRKQLSIGNKIMNIHPINSNKNTISGHTDSFADVLIKYDNIEEIVNADDKGLFEYNITSSIPDGTEIELTANVSGSFIYTKRTVTTPFTGELTLLDANTSLSFAKTPITGTYIFPKTEDLKIKIVDSRIDNTDWNLYVYVNNPLTSANGFTLEEALIFKKFNDEIITLTANPEIVYTGNNEGTISYKEINWSKEKGPLLDLTNEVLEANEEYFATIYFNIEE